MDSVTIEGAVIELDAALDSLDQGSIDFESFVGRVEHLRDRLRTLLDMAAND